MKEFFVTYGEEVWKPYMKWCGKHWKEIIVFNIVVLTAEAAVLYYDEIKEKAQEVIDEIKAKF